MLYLQSVGASSTLFTDDSGIETSDPTDIDAMLACEQSLYWAELGGVNCTNMEVMYFYHPDYLGSIEFISDMRGEPYQFFLNTPWGENLENQYRRTYTSFSSRFRFNGKEWDEETGNFYYGARYYDPKISVWLSVDPLAHEYPSLSPYNFVANNPIMNFDPDGRKIWIWGDDNEPIEYTAGMKYEGDNSFVAETVNLLNKMNSTENGGVVLNDLIESDGIYEFTSKESPINETLGFKGESDMLGGTFLMGKGNGGLEELAHEVFHAYQHEKGQGGASIHNEVEAYLFGNSIALQYSLNSGDMVVSTTSGMGVSNKEAGVMYENAFKGLLWGGFNEDVFNTAVNNFKDGAIKNKQGTYNSFPLQRNNQKRSLIKGFYPLIN